MQETDPGFLRWLVEGLLAIISGGIGWWVHTVQSDSKELRKKQEGDSSDLHDRITQQQQHNAETFARRDDVRIAVDSMRGDMQRGFGDLNSKVDMLVKHALKGGEG